MKKYYRPLLNYELGLRFIAYCDRYGLKRWPTIDKLIDQWLKEQEALQGTKGRE